MKKRYVVLIGILAIVIISIGIFAYNNRNSILALQYGLTTTQEEWEEEKIKNDQRTLDAVKDYGIETIRPLTDEEAEKLKKGELTEEEAIELILGNNAGTTDNKPPQKNNETSENSEKTEEELLAEQKKLQEANARISQLVGKMYVLKAQFTAELSEVENWVVSEYRKLTPEERESNSVKMKIAKEAISKASALENSCDAQVEEIITELTTLLKETGQSTTLVTEIKEAYENEKKLAKSYYLSKA